MAMTSVSKMDASVWGMLLAEVRLLPIMSIERIESLPCESCLKPVNPFIVAVVIRANEPRRAEAVRLVLPGRGRARSAGGSEFKKGVQMSPFDYYMYVLACGDGSLYTGYATDVQARLAAHQSGRGAKCTNPMRPSALSLSPVLLEGSCDECGGSFQAAFP
ncbi:MAG: GIY-YIG nuclease family protein [Collinsella sp.]